MPAQRTAARKAITTKPYVKQSLPSDYSATPSLASSREDLGGSSDFAPETPTKENHLKLYEEDDDDDMKPDLSDDEMYGTPNSDGYDDDEDIKPKIKKSSKTKAGSSIKTPKSKTQANSKTPGSSAKKLGQAWTGDQDWALFQYIHPKVAKPDWRNAAMEVGRDAKVSDGTVSDDVVASS